MRLILHIGDGKCGTSAIQEALYRSRVSLESAGILFDTGPNRRDHFLLRTLLGDSTRGFGPEAKRIEYARHNLRSIAKKAVNYDCVLLSAESLFSAEPGAVIDLLNSFNINTSDAHAIAYVRSPCSMYPSLVQQQLKGHSRFTLPHQYHRPIHKFIASWRDAVGSNNTTIQLYDRDRLMGHDVVHDFSATLRKLLGPTVPMLPSVQANQSISAEQLVALQKVRRQLLSRYEGKLHPLSNQIIKAFEKMNVSGRIGNAVKLNIHAEAIIHKNNVTVCEELNRIIPTLQISTGATDNAKRYSVTSPSWSGEDSSVIEILENVDGELADLFFDITMLSKKPHRLNPITSRLKKLKIGQNKRIAIEDGMEYLISSNVC